MDGQEHELRISATRPRAADPAPTRGTARHRRAERRSGAAGAARAGTVMMMGDNPALPPMPRAPKLLDFFRLRFQDITFRHLLQSAQLALDEGRTRRS